jgi:hypothetical protein
MVSARTKLDRTVAKPNRHMRVLLAGGAIAGMAALGLLIVPMMSSHDEPGQPGTARLCPSFDVDPNTGNLRNKGMIPCSSPTAQNGRLDLIRDSFKAH